MPTPLLIQGTTVANIPELFRAYSEVQPFNYRDGATYTQILESMRVWILDDLVPYLNTNFSDIQDNWDENIQNIVAGINDALQTALNAIANANVIITDPAVLAAFNAVTSQSRDYLDNRYQAKASYVLRGTGIDPTGVADSTAAVQAFFDNLPSGASVVVPGDAIINLTGTINLTKKVRVSGFGELRWTAGIANSAMFLVTADGCRFEDLLLTNPSHLAATTGNKTAGILFQANYGWVSRCHIIGQQQAICVNANGEWHTFHFTDNTVRDVPGSGGGPSDVTNSTGEDRGDGIVCWGAVATITGNRVSALFGTDARIGIHVEGLPGFENPATPYNMADSSCTITGNIVSGKFRRGIVSETVSSVTITGNVIWDSTWWCIAVIGSAHGCVVANNTINWTRTNSDNQGGAYTPKRSGIMIYGGNQDTIVIGNVIRVLSGLMPNGITLDTGSTAPGANPQNTTIQSNRISDAANGIGNGININNSSTDTRILDNDISGLTAIANGINAFKADKLVIRGNKIKGLSTSQGKGIYVSSTGTTVRCDFNTVDTFGVGISLFTRSVYTTAIGNVIANAATGIDFFQTVIPVTESDNTFASVTTKTANVPASTVAVGNN